MRRNEQAFSESVPTLFYSPAVVFLVAANAVTVFGVLFRGWSVENIVLIYWFESVVVGLYTCLKILLARPTSIGRVSLSRFSSPVSFGMSLLFRIVTIFFFVIFFGLFLLLHGIFVSAIVDHRMAGAVPFETEFFQEHVQEIFLAVFALTISHGVSFIQHYLGRREYIGANPLDLAGRPYNRLILIQITVTLGTLVAVALQGDGRVYAIVLIAGKVWLDIRAHLAEHGQLNGSFGLGNRSLFRVPKI